MGVAKLNAYSARRWSAMKVVVRDKCYYCWVSLLLQKSVLLLQDYTTKTKLLQQCGPFKTIINFYWIVVFEMKKWTWSINLKYCFLFRFWTFKFTAKIFNVIFTLFMGVPLSTVLFTFNCCSKYSGINVKLIYSFLI